MLILGGGQRELSTWFRNAKFALRLCLPDPCSVDAPAIKKVSLLLQVLAVP